MTRTSRTHSNLGDKIRRFLIREGCRPGDRVESELALARRFKAPRAKVREVLTSLCQQGLLERRPRAGTIVRELDSHQLGEALRFRFRMAGLDEADAFEARKVIESAILPLVIRRATPSQIRRLDELVDRMEQNLAHPERADEADREFHLYLLKCCGNRTLALFSGVIEGLFDEECRTRFRKRSLQKQAAAEHRQLVRAIARDDTDAAMKTLTRHFAHYYED